MAMYKNRACYVMGDFNFVQAPSERKGMGAKRMNRAEMDMFNSFIDRFQLLDIPVVGRLFTRYRQMTLPEVGLIKSYYLNPSC